MNMLHTKSNPPKTKLNGYYPAVTLRRHPPTAKALLDATATYALPNEHLLTAAAAEAKVASSRTIINFCEFGGNHTDPNPSNRGPRERQKQACPPQRPRPRREEPNPKACELDKI
eukprot:scaffold15978_cov103-Isochrysis_galbana.AAC.9